CLIENGQRGICGVRENQNGKLFALNYGKACALNIDPIEKKPLYHYYPGTNIVSIAQSGCNLNCPFCQNSEISQNTNISFDTVSIDKLYSILDNYNEDKIAFTYTEPLVWYEYIYDFAVKYRDIKIVIVSNGHINKKPMEKLAPLISAANIDIKSFNDKYYRSVLGGNLNTVKQSIEILFSNEVHIEITHLLIENDNDNDNEFNEMIDFISNVSPNIPLHISRYFPAYTYHKKPTSLERLEQFYSIARQKLNFVYLGNIPGNQFSTTICPNCGNKLIIRNLYSIEMSGIENSQCRNCDISVPVIM
ncbi:AmmeMemoRadiSam system radical SAM enzyme, partial [candidate division WOR-3 bacterium]|nr:AmmeMemoRadiSam system radical SAM enzyme [candidate division WOR-3 bacterium]